MKKGYITVFFALVFMVLVSFVLSIFEGIKINALRLKAECAFSVAANSVLGEYQVELLNMYDLFYIDTSYKTGSPDYHMVETHFWEYLDKNLGNAPLSAEVNQIVLATDNKGIPYRKQITDYMKDKIGISYVEQLTQMFETVSKEGVLKDDLVIENTWNIKWQKELARKENISEDTWKQIKKYSPIENAYDIRDSFMLSQVIENEKSISKKRVNTSDYVSNRSCIQGTGTEAELTFLDKVYFIGYLFEKFSYYSEKISEKPLDYEVEYLIGGMGSDYENLSSVAKKVLFIRESINLVYLMSDSEKMSIIREVATALAAIIVNPELEPVYEVLIVGLWSYAESINDLQILFKGDKVPLIKTKENWKTDFDSGFGLNFLTCESAENETGMDYKQYLELLLLFSNDEKITYRSMDLIEMNIRETEGNENFRMDGCAEDFVVNLIFDIPVLDTYQIVRKFGYFA